MISLHTQTFLHAATNNILDMSRTDVQVRELDRTDHPMTT